MTGQTSSYRRAEVLARNGGMCIYCGGNAPATTIDHMPPISMFLRRDRPSGLEFPSCKPCNNGARKADLVAGHIGRIFPDSRGSAELAEVAYFMRAVKQNVPGLLQEMVAPRGSEKLMLRRLGRTEGGALKLSGPLVTAYLDAFGARVGLAMHFEKTGRAVPPAGGVSVFTFSNVQIEEGKIPDIVFEHLPPGRDSETGTKKCSGPVCLWRGGSRGRSNDDELCGVSALIRPPLLHHP